MYESIKTTFGNLLEIFLDSIISPMVVEVLEVVLNNISNNL